MGPSARIASSSKAPKKTARWLSAKNVRKLAGVLHAGTTLLEGVPKARPYARIASAALGAGLSTMPSGDELLEKLRAIRNEMRSTQSKGRQTPKNRALETSLIETLDRYLEAV